MNNPEVLVLYTKNISLISRWDHLAAVGVIMRNK